MFKYHNNVILLDNWKFAQYAVNYSEYGFIKRGLIGTILNSVLGHFSILAIYILFYIQVVFLLFITIYTLNQLQNRFIDFKSYIVFSLILLLSPATFSHFVYDFGRFDLILILFFILQLYLYKNKMLFASSLVSCIGILTHEIYLLIFTLSMFIIFIYDRYKYKNKYTALFKLMTLPALAALLLYFFGKYEQTLDILVSKLQTDIGMGWNNVDSAKVWTRSIIDIVSMAMKSLQTPKTLINILIMSFFFLNTFIYIVIFSVKNDIKISFLFLIPFFPLILLFLAIDHSRWFSFATILLYIVFLWILFENKNKKLYHPCFGYSLYMLFLSILLGPYGVTDTFFWIEKAIGKVAMLMNHS